MRKKRFSVLTNQRLNFFRLNLKHLVWRKPCTTHHLRNTMLIDASSVMMCECFSTLEYGTIVRVDGQLNGCMYHLNEKQDLILGKRFPFQHDHVSTQPRQCKSGSGKIAFSTNHGTDSLWDASASEQRVWIFSSNEAATQDISNLL